MLQLTFAAAFQPWRCCFSIFAPTLLLMSDRITKLRAMLAKTPADPFLLYAIGIELKKIPDLAGAVDQFEKTIAADPKYCYAYYQLGQTHEQAGDFDRARDAYTRGIAAAKVASDMKALGELQGALDVL
jgi:tetratricopeptide (TPR) repeat protein